MLPYFIIFLMFLTSTSSFASDCYSSCLQFLIGKNEAPQANAVHAYKHNPTNVIDNSKTHTRGITKQNFYNSYTHSAIIIPYQGLIKTDLNNENTKNSQDIKKINPIEYRLTERFMTGQ